MTNNLGTYRDTIPVSALIPNTWSVRECGDNQGIDNKIGRLKGGFRGLFNGFATKILCVVVLVCLNATAWSQIALPYSYGFEDNNLSNDGWTTQNPHTSNTSEFGIYGVAANDGDYGFRFSSYSSNDDGYDQYLISPQLSAATGTILQFYYAASSSSGEEVFKVGYSTTNTNISSFTFGEEISTNNTSWTLSEEFLFPAGTKYVAIWYYSQFEYRLYVDDFTFSVPPSCIKPISLGASSISNNSATISWTANNGESSWNLRYKKVSDASWTTVPGPGINTNPYTLAGLSSGTEYLVQVQAKCSESDLSDWSSEYEFTTALCSLGDQCEITLSLTDSYGDGWNGNAIRVKDASTDIVLGEFANTTEADAGVAQNYTLAVCNGREIEFEWVSGSYASEASYVVTDVNGDEIFSGSGAMESTESYIVNCSITTCPKPTDLAVSNIDVSSATIDWTAGGTESAWQICLNGDEEHLINVSGKPYYLTGLTAGTLYTIKVRANCGGGNGVSSWTSNEEFVTELCALANRCEISYSLEDSYGDGWNGNAINVIDNATDQIIDTWTIASGSSETGTLSVCNGREIRFKWVSGSYPGETSYEVTDANGEVIFSGSGSMSEDVYYTVICSSCRRPTSLAVSSITTSSATITWIAGATETTWVLKYGLTGFDVESAGTSVNVSPTPSYTLTGLMSSSSYDVYVKSVCGVGDESIWQKISFGTECDKITSFPWIEDFNSLSVANTIPVCWDNSDGTTSYDSYKWSFNTSTSGNGATSGTSYDNSNCVRFDSYVNSSGNTNMLKTPVFDLSQFASAELKFQYKNPDGGDFSVFVSTDGGGTYTTALATGLTDQSDWEEKTIDISSYCGSGNENVVIVFKGTSNYGDNDAYIYLDDVKIIPVCASNGLVYSIPSPSVTYGDNGNLYTNALTNPNDLPVTYSIYSQSPAGTATINTTTGQLSIAKVGTVTVRATFAGNVTYCAGYAEYSLTVDCMPISDDDFHFENTSLPSVTLAGSVSNPLTNTLGLGVTYSSSDEEVATVASNGAVTLVGYGTVTITAEVLASGNYCAKTASYSFLVTCDNPPSITYSDATYDAGTNTFTYTQGQGMKYPGILYNGTAFPSTTVCTSSNTDVAMATNGIVRVNTARLGTSNITFEVPAQGGFCAMSISFNVSVVCESAEIDYGAGYNSSTHTFTFEQNATIGENHILYTHDAFTSNVLPAGTICESSDESVAYYDNINRKFVIDNSEGNKSATVSISIPAHDGICDVSTGEFYVEITCNSPSISYNSTYNYEMLLNAPEEPLTIIYPGIADNKLPAGTTCISSNNAIAYLSADNKVMLNKGGVGTANVTLNIPPYQDKCPTSISFTVNVSSSCDASSEISASASEELKSAPIYVDNKDQYSYSQQIYTKSELNAAGISGPSLINKLSFYSKKVNRDYSISIYMANTSKADFSDEKWERDGLTAAVIEKSVRFPNSTDWQEVEITLDRPFEWDGSSNLLVAIYSPITKSLKQGSFKAKTISKKTLYYNTDRSSYIALNHKLPHESNTYGNVSGKRPVISFCTVPQYTLTYEASTNTSLRCTGTLNNIPQPQYGRGRIRLVSTAPGCTSKTFVEWNTSNDGTGTRYMPGDVFNLTSNTTLYAIFRDCSSIASSSIVVPDGQYDGTIPYYQVCLGSSVELRGATNVSDVREWRWRINTHDGSEPVILLGQNVTYTPDDVYGNDVDLYVLNSTGCYSSTHGRIKISDGPHTQESGLNYPDPLCIGKSLDISIGASGSSSTIHVLPQVINIEASLGKGETTFIPDGPNCLNDCYESSVTFYDFSDTATIWSINHINYLRLNMEHSFVGDLRISLKCPSGHEAVVMVNYKEFEEAGNAWPYKYTSGGTTYYRPYLFFGVPSTTTTSVCDEDGNPEGIGWNYCWSEKTAINGNNITYATGGNKSLYNTANHSISGDNKVAIKSDPENLTNFYKPWESFIDELRGCPLNGTWTVSICDTWEKDNGYIFDWELSLEESLIPDPWAYNIDVVDKEVNNLQSFANFETPYEHIIFEPTEPEHVGSYSCRLILTDQYGCKSKPLPITYSVSEAFHANISQPGAVCVGSSTTLDASVNPSLVPTYHWSDGSTSNAINPTVFANSHYDVTVTSSALDGCKSYAHADVNIKYPLAGTFEGDFVWSGISDDWDADNNWFKLTDAAEGTYTLQSGSGREYPSVGSDVFLTSYYDCISNPVLYVGANAEAKNLTVGDGITIKGGTNKVLSIAGDLIFNGSADFVPETGMVKFVGLTDQTITKSDVISFNNVQFAQTNEGDNVYMITADNDISISGSATFTKGIVDGKTLFTKTGSVANANTMTYNSYVADSVVKIGDGANAFTFPTGYDNVLGTLTATIGNDKRAAVKFNHKIGTGEHLGYTWGEGPDNFPRWWNVNDMCAGTDASPKFDHVSNYEYWKVNTSENLSGVTLKVAASGDGAHFNSNYDGRDNTKIYAAAHYDCWKNVGGPAQSGSGSAIEVRGVNLTLTRAGSFDGIVTLGSTDHSTVLPIELTAFRATCDGRSSYVRWTTATEKNNDYFILERSDNAIEFYEVARVAGAGNSIAPLNYSYTDYGVHGGDNYYRLVQVDYDGTRMVSEMIVATCVEASEEPEVLAYPNPFNGDLTIELENFDNRPARIDVYDVLGKLVYTEDADAPQNNYQTVLHLGALPEATYTVRVATNDFVINRKVVKQ